MRLTTLSFVLTAGFVLQGQILPNAEAGSADQVKAMHVFAEPLSPFGEEPTGTENAQLLKALKAVQGSQGRDIKPIQEFLIQHPSSPWRLSLLTQMGVIYRQSGYFSRALDAWEEAWTLGQTLKGASAQTLTDQAGSELADLMARLGRTESLEQLLKALAARHLRGSAADRAIYAKESLNRLKTTPERNYRCGPLAIASLAKALGKATPGLQEENGAPSGTSLTYNQKLAARFGLSVQPAWRESKVEPIVPSVLHLRSGHFAAVVKESNGRFLLQDPTFGDDLWITRAALEDEWSGYALIPGTSQPAGYRAVLEPEAQKVMGKGGSPNGDPNANSECNTTTGSGCKNSKGGPCPGMPAHSFHSLLASLFIQDTPVGYAPPKGPAAYFSISYSQREINQPQTFNYSNLGSKWRFNYQAYVQDDPTIAIDVPTVSMIVKCAGRGGGLKSFVFNAAMGSKPPLNPDTGPSEPNPEDHSVMVRSGLSSYTRYFVDGSKEIYEQPDGSHLYPRKILLTQVVDATGSILKVNYDAQNRITTLVDALGQATTLTYGLAADPLKITEVKDPFGRTAAFEYNAAGQLLRVTDVIGLATEFAYGPTTEAPDSSDDFLNAMKTPYGIYRYFQGMDSDTRWVEAMDPQGGRERVEFKRHPVVKVSDANLMPSGFVTKYPSGTFYWNQRLMALYPRNYDRAQLTRWLVGNDGEGSVDIPHSLRGPDSMDTYETWFAYPGQSNSSQKGSLALPSRVIRATGDGGFQEYRYEYNSLGRPTKVMDPAGRQTILSYDTDKNLDLLSVEQVSQGHKDLLATYTYNDKHLPLKATDASGQTTTFIYYDSGQLKSITNPKGQSTTLAYKPNGQLETVSGPGGRTSSFTYDAVGRVKMVTDPEAQTVTMDYDALDRPVTVTYDDGTFEGITYDRLDVSVRRDRTGRRTIMRYNALRQLVEVEDALGRVTHLDWCGCGTLDGLTDSMGRTTNWIRDLNSRVVAKMLPDRTGTSFGYDPLGRLSRRIDAKGQITTYTYNLDNTLQGIDYSNSRRTTPASPVRFTYDPDYNRVATMTDGTGTTQYSYHPITNPAQLGAGRLASEISPMAHSTITYGYDELGRVVSRSINGQTAAVTYDDLGRPSQVSNALGAFTFGFEGSTSRLSALGLPNGMNTAFSYFDATQQHRLKEIHHQTANGSTVSKFGYTYDPFGQIQTWTQQADAATPKTYTFSYDAVEQLLDAKLKGANGDLLRSFLYGYDPAGNRTSETVDGISASSDFNESNQLIKRRTASADAPVKQKKAQKTSAKAQSAAAKPKTPRP